MENFHAHVCLALSKFPRRCYCYFYLCKNLLLQKQILFFVSTEFTEVIHSVRSSQEVPHYLLVQLASSKVDLHIQSPKNDQTFLHQARPSREMAPQELAIRLYLVACEFKCRDCLPICMSNSYLCNCRTQFGAYLTESR